MSTTLSGRGLITVEHNTASDTLTEEENGTLHTSVGAAGEIILALPVAAVGLNYKFYVGAAQNLVIEPNGSDAISLPSTGVPGTGGVNLVANAIGETVDLVCAKAGVWACFGFTGTWAAGS